MSLTYDSSLVFLSLVLAIQGSYVGLRIALQVSGSSGTARRLLLTSAACSLAVGIWSMHFVGMLAARLPAPVNYLVLPTLLSFLVCVLVVGIALEAVSLWPRALTTFVAAAIFMGGGIGAMHYIGMTALHESAHMTHNLAFAAASILISIVASGAALWLAFATSLRPPLLLCALLLGLAISGMHYVAMAGTTLHAMAHETTQGSPAVSPDMLAIFVTLVAFALSGVFLLTFVPELPGRPTTAPDILPTGPASSIIAEAGKTAEMHAPGGQSRETVPVKPPLSERALPIEHEGLKKSIKAAQIVAVHADAHYTFVFDGQDRFFCPLAIGEVEEQLEGGAFLRVHRSHIVNLAYVKSVRRTGDNAVAELSGASARIVPVSRTKFAELRALVSQRAQARPIASQS